MCQIKSIVSYLNEVESAWSRRQGNSLASLFAVCSERACMFTVSIDEQYIERTCIGRLSSSLVDIVVCHLKCVCSLIKQNYLDAYNHQSNLVAMFTKLFSAQKEDNSLLPLMFRLSLDLRRTAINADRCLICMGNSSTANFREKAAEGLMNCFRVCAADTRADINSTKRWGMLYIINQLFKIYFVVNKLHLCKPLIRAFDSLPIKEQFPVSQLVTYNYFIGRKFMFDCDYNAAATAFRYAFTHCHRDSHSNKRRILIYLVPIEMLLGRVPSPRVLDTYDLGHQFGAIVASVCRGHLSQLKRAIDANQDFFIEHGVYLILDKLQTIAYRNLFKLVFTICGSVQISIAAFHTALRVSGEDPEVSAEETACILANQIYEGRIKGYISHSHQKVVLSKKDPFPVLANAS